MGDFETLDDWTDEQQKEAAATVATARYGSLSEALRRSLTEARLCSMFCGGKNCKYEGPANWSEEQQAISGLYSHWITANILAMARPNSQNIEQYDMMQNFKKCGITSVINLQLVGEHTSCGPGLEPSGFTYLPQQFMDANIFFYNYGWQDYSFGTMVGIADVVRVMQFELSKGKVAIHCHAGLGRTGVLIACYLVYTNRCDPDIAIHYIRRKRPGSIQTRSQIKCIREFSKFLTPSRIVFCSAMPKSSPFTLGQFLHRQRYAVHGTEARRLKYLPRIVYVCCDRLLEVASRLCLDETHRGHLFHMSSRLLTGNNSSTATGAADSSQAAAGYFAGEVMPPAAAAATSRRSAVESRLCVINLRPSVSCESFLPVPVVHAAGRLSPLPPLTSRSTQLTQLLSTPQLHPVRQSWAPGSSSSHSDDHISLPGMRTTTSTTSPGGVTPAERVALAMASSVCPPEVRTKVDAYKQQLNTSPMEWKTLGLEQDPLVLSVLMFDWIDELKEPVLSIQDLPMLLEHVSQPSAVINFLQKGVRQTISYLFHAVACLEPLNDELRDAVIQRVTSTLLQQKVVTELDDVSVSTSLSYDQLLQRTANDGLMRPEVARRVLAFFTLYLRERRDQVCACCRRRVQKKPAAAAALAVAAAQTSSA